MQSETWIYIERLTPAERMLDNNWVNWITEPVRGFGIANTTTRSTLNLHIAAKNVVCRMDRNAEACGVSLSRDELDAISAK